MSWNTRKHSLSAQTLSTSSAIDRDPRLLVQPQSPWKPDLKITSTSNLSRALSPQMRCYLGLLPQPWAPQVHDPMDLWQQIVGRSQQIATLSWELWVLKSQAIQIRQYPPPMLLQDIPLHKSAHEIAYNQSHCSVPQSIPHPSHLDGQLPYPLVPFSGYASTYNSLVAPSYPMSILEPALSWWTNGHVSWSNALASPDYIPQMPLAPTIQSSNRYQCVTTPRYHEYGDCGESIPLAVMKKLSTLAGQAEVRSVAAFTTKLRCISSVPEDGTIKESIRLRGPCLNCKSLMQQFPATVNVLAASGWSDNIQWVGGGYQPAYVSEVPPAHPFQTTYTPSCNIDFSLSAAYGATKEGIYAILKIYTLSNKNPFIATDIKKNLVDLWYDFIVPYRYVHFNALSFVIALSYMKSSQAEVVSWAPIVTTVQYSASTKMAMLSLPCSESMESLFRFVLSFARWGISSLRSCGQTE